MKYIKTLLLVFSIFYCSITFAQSRDVSVKLRHGLPNVLKVTNVRVYSGSSTSSKISIWIAVKKGKVVSVSRGKGRLDNYNKDTRSGFNLCCFRKILQDRW